MNNYEEWVCVETRNPYYNIWERTIPGTENKYREGFPKKDNPNNQVINIGGYTNEKL